MSKLMVATMVLLAGLTGCAEDAMDRSEGKVRPGLEPGSAWQLVEMTGKSGPIKPVGTVTLAVDQASGQVSGSAGCNRYSAGYRATADGIAVERAAYTKRFCGEPKGLMDQEARFLELLAGEHELTAGKAGELKLKCDAGTLTFAEVPKSTETKGS